MLSDSKETIKIYKSVDEESKRSWRAQTSAKANPVQIRSPASVVRESGVGYGSG